MKKITDADIELDDCNYSIRFLNVSEKTENEQTLIFLHDALGSIAQWKKFPEAIVAATKLPAVLIERQGYGNSSSLKKPRTNHYLHHEAWVVLPKLLEKLSIINPILIGHSDGASIALLYGSKHTTKCIISIAAHIFVEDITIKGIKETALDSKVIKTKLHKYHGDKGAILFDEWQKVWLSDSFLNWNIEWELSNIKCDVLAIQSKDDNYGTLEQIDGIINMVQGKTSKLILDTGGHAPHLNKPEELIKPIRDFIINQNI